MFYRLMIASICGRQRGRRGERDEEGKYGTGVPDVSSRLLSCPSPLTRFWLDAQRPRGGFETSHIVVADLGFFPPLA
jgi:hypothetical protein